MKITGHRIGLINVENLSIVQIWVNLLDDKDSQNDVFVGTVYMPRNRYEDQVVFDITEDQLLTFPFRPNYIRVKTVLKEEDQLVQMVKYQSKEHLKLLQERVRKEGLVEMILKIICSKHPNIIT
jgi:hypothetical protein